MKLLSLIVAATFLDIRACRLAATRRRPQTSADAEGLVKVKVPGLQTVYARPGVNLSGYDKVMLDPIAVAFSKNWEPRTPLRRITAEEQQEIKTGPGEGPARGIQEGAVEVAALLRRGHAWR